MPAPTPHAAASARLSRCRGKFRKRQTAPRETGSALRGPRLLPAALWAGGPRGSATREPRSPPPRGVPGGKTAHKELLQRLRTCPRGGRPAWAQSKEEALPAAPPPATSFKGARGHRPPPATCLPPPPCAVPPAWPWPCWPWRLPSLCPPTPRRVGWAPPGTCQERPHLPRLGLEAGGRGTEGAEWGRLTPWGVSDGRGCGRCPETLTCGVPGREVTPGRRAWAARPRG